MSSEKMLLWCSIWHNFQGLPKKIKIRNHLSLLPFYADLLKPKQHNITYNQGIMSHEKTFRPMTTDR